MRRALSAILFVVGGWLLMGEPLVAFMDFGPELRSAAPIVWLITLIMAAIPLSIAVAASPGERWRELGLTILIACGVAAFSGLSALAMFTDPGFKQFLPLLPPMPRIGIAPVPGALNFAVLAGLGWLLYVFPRKGLREERR